VRLRKGQTPRPSLRRLSVSACSSRETLLWCTLLFAFAGCCCPRSRDLAPPVIAKPTLAHRLNGWWHGATGDLDSAVREFHAATSIASLHPGNPEVAAALSENAYAVADSMHRSGDDRAVDYWARTIAWADEAIHLRSINCPEVNCNLLGPSSRLSWLRRSAETSIFLHAQPYGRLVPSSYLLINGQDHPVYVPITRHGFVWQASDFDRLLVYEPNEAPGNLCGHGVPLVILSPSEPFDDSTTSLCSRIFGAEATPSRSSPEQEFAFVQPGTPFAATGVTCFPISMFTDVSPVVQANDDSFQGPSVDFYNPLTLPAENDRSRIAQSPAMPLAFIRQNSPYNPLRVFLNGDAGVNEARLRFFEPFQPDKIPLVFVHGLISDPTTFIEMADAIRADAELRTRYQIWAFRYPTGEPFLKSAATLRRQLAAAFALRYQCDDQDHVTTAFDAGERAVLVGHSMGGLIAKMQITDSSDRLWRSVANVPFEQLRGPPDRLAKLQQSFFFTANPNIGRVVYIATPHRGSPWASRCIGRLGGLLARQRLPDEQAYNELVALNPNAFSGELGDSFPSSVELLRPSSRLLQSLAALQSSPHTTTHSIIGDHCRLPLAGRSDGVVPIDNAHVPDAESTAIVDASHTSIQHSIDAQQELLRILREHLATSTLWQSSSPPHRPLARGIGF
jgi:pimeloyl-ACP methyl ester carboxylesterase